jgi:transcriptional regulator with GAF, ATPase, and Fis domain
MAISTRDLHRALKELHTLRFGEIDVDEAMQRIVRATHTIFDVDGAGLMLADEDQLLRNAAVSDPRFARLERLQQEHGEGPCVTAYEEKDLVCVDDLADDGARKRWPQFCPAALDEGVAAVLASPIPFNQSAIGVVAVLSEDARPWTPEGELALMAFTDLAALMIASVMHGQQQSELAGQLRGALDSRVVIEQAKGILAARDHLSMREAYEQLRAQARRERRRLSEVAGRVVAETAPV